MLEDWGHGPPVRGRAAHARGGRPAGGPGAAGGPGPPLGAPVSGLDGLAAVVFEATQELVPVTHPQPFQADVVLARGRVPRELASFPLEG
jgi:hypothetical protein